MEKPTKTLGPKANLQAQKRKSGDGYAINYNVNFHFDNYPNKEAYGRVKISLVVNIGGKKEYYAIKPKAFMYRKFWREAIDPDTGKKLGHKFIQSRGNPDYERVFPVITAAKSEMECAIETILKRKKHLSHAQLKRRWNRKSTAFHAFIVDYVNTRRGKIEPDTIKKMSRVGKLVEIFDAKINISEITWEWLEMFENWCLNDAPNPHTGGKGRSPATVSGYMGTLGTVLRRAKRQDEIEEDPYHEYKDLEDRTKQYECHPNPLSIDDVLRLQAAFDSEELIQRFPESVQGQREKRGERWHRYLRMILVSVYTGVRYSDLRKLFDQTQYVIRNSPRGERLHFTMKKSKRDHSILVTDRLRSVMTDSQRGFFFKGKSPSKDALRVNFKSILEALEINPNHKWHDLRKTFANLVRELSEDDYGSSRALGHTSLAVSQRHYFSRTNPQADRAVAALDKLGATGPEMPDPDEILYEIRLLSMLNPGMKMTPKIQEWLKVEENDVEGGAVVPFGLTS